MLNLPNKVNGYTLLAVMPILRNTRPPRFLQDGEGIILGEDLSRQHGKWVVAHIPIGAAEQPREWFWGFYTDELAAALDRFIEKTQMKLAFEYNPSDAPTDDAFQA